MKQQRGFTIIELLIAMTVFATILLLLTTSIIQIGHVYYKGITASKTQEVARSILEDVSQAIQFEGGAFTTNASPAAYCFGSNRFTYVKGKQLIDSGSASTTQSPHVLVFDKPTTCGTNPTVDLANPTLSTTFGARELVGTKMRLAKFDIASLSNNLYSVSVRVVYGDDDLLCSPAAGDCNNTTTNASSLTAPDLTCKSFQAGTQFCAVSELNTTVQKRVTN